MAIQDYQNVQHGKIESYFQELRLSGTFGGKGSWLVGGNYEYDETWDQFLHTYNGSSASPTILLQDPVTLAILFAVRWLAAALSTRSTTAHPFPRRRT